MKKHSLEFFGSLFFIILTGTIFWLSWNYIAIDLFKFLPPNWMELGWLQSFCFVLVVRTLSAVMRMQTPKGKREE